MMKKLIYLGVATISLAIQTSLPAQAQETMDDVSFTDFVCAHLDAIEDREQAVEEVLIQVESLLDPDQLADLEEVRNSETAAQDLCS